LIIAAKAKMVMGGWEFEAHTDASMENISQASYQTLFEK